MAALPTTNITTTLVANTLGVTTRNVGKLCASSKINMWSKRKPVRDTRLSIPANEVGVGNSPNSAENYGLIIPAYQGDDSLLTTYARPTGGSSSPYRLGDFRGYDHKAVAPVTIPPPPSKLEKRENIIAAMIAMPGGSNVTIGDIFGFLGDLRIGVMVYQSGGGLIGAASSSTPGGGSVDIDLSNLVYSSLDIKFCLTDYYKPWSTPGGMTALYEIPRAYLGQNQNWINIPLKAYTPPAEVSLRVSHNPIDECLEIEVKTRTKTGPILITYRRYDDDVAVWRTGGLSITAPNVVHTFYESNISWLVPGKTYKAVLTTPTDTSLFAEDTFGVFMINDRN
jgi:hypothetical protein